MYAWTPHAHLVPFDGDVHLDALSSTPPDGSSKKRDRAELAEQNARIAELQRVLYAHDTRAVLCVFQGMDASGKDSTIRKVFSGVNPAGCRVWSFKAPSALELSHDFLWRCQRRAPPRGTIGVFNRSHYEEVLVVRVHPGYLAGARLTATPDIWERRFRAIRDWEQHLADSGTVVLKFFLNVSRDEQRRRFVSRIDEAEKNWKFNEGDVAERAHWPAYQAAFQDVLSETSRPWAPWYAVPADDKRYMRATIARVVADTLDRLDLHYPRVDDERRATLARMRDTLTGS